MRQMVKRDHELDNTGRIAKAREVKEAAAKAKRAAARK